LHIYWIEGRTASLELGPPQESKGGPTTVFPG
jgi:hypothetical protein